MVTIPPSITSLPTTQIFTPNPLLPPTFTDTFTPSPTTNPPPPPPPTFSVNLLQPDGSVPCSTDAVLYWEEPYDPDGIRGYQLVITGMHSEIGEATIYEDHILENEFYLGEIPIEYCEWDIIATLSAEDNLGALGPEATVRFFLAP